MITSARRWACLLIALACLFLVAATGPAAAGAVRTAADPVPGEALDRYGSCLNAQHAGDLLLLIDTSGSIKSTDPAGARVEAARYLLQQLESYTRASGVQLDVAVAGFADSFQKVADWTPLDAGSLPALTSAVASFQDRVDGFETDYWTALEGARESFAQRAPLTPAGDRCQAVAWFTDGELDISTRTTGAEADQYGLTKPYAGDTQLDTDAGAQTAKDAAAQDICRPAGLADQLRAARVVALAIGLAPPDRDAPDFGPLQSIATGSSACGAISQQSPGEFYQVANFDDLILAFDQLSTPGQPPLETQKRVCQGGPCASEEHVFVLDDSIPSVHILAAANAVGLTVLLTPPSGATVTLTNPGNPDPQLATADGNDVSYSWRSDTALSIDVSKGAAATTWTGKWAVNFVDPASQSADAMSHSNIHLSTDMYPAILSPIDTLASGAVAGGLTFGIRTAAGVQIDPATLQGMATMTAALFGPDGKPLVIANAVDSTALATPLTADLTAVPPGPATLRMTLAVTTAATVDAAGQPVPGTPLAPRTVDLPLTVVPAPVPLVDATQPAPTFPTIAYRADFGTSDQLTSKAELLVTGSGCVWLPTDGPQTILAAPKDIGIKVSAPSAGSADSCLAVADGEKVGLPLQFAIDQPGTGGVNGTVAVMIAPRDHLDQAVQVTVEFTADLRKPVVPALFWGAFAIALILALGIPLALLYLAKYVSAKIPPVPMAHVAIGVSITDGQLSRHGSGFVFRENELRQVVSVSGAGRKRLPVDGVELRTVVGLSPIGPGHVVVHSPGLVGAASTQPPWTGKSVAARLPLAVHNNWVILHDPTGDPTQAQVLVLLDAAGDDQLRVRIADDIKRRAAELFTALRAAAGDAGLTAAAPAQVAVGAGYGSGGTSGNPAPRGFGFDDDPPAGPRGFG